MEVKIEKMSVEDLAQRLIQGKVDVNDLNILKLNQREAFASAIKQRPSILSKIKPQNIAHLVPFALAQDYKNFIHLKPEQYTDELVQIYFWHRFNEKSEKNGKAIFAQNGFSLHKSRDERVMIHYTYTPAEEDVVHYPDPELGLPVSLSVKLRATLKITDAITLINRFDISIAQLGPNRIRATIAEIFNSACRSCLYSYIKANNVGFYALSSSYPDLEAALLVSINSAFASYGIIATELVVKALAIPKDLQNKIEDQDFELRQRRAVALAEDELAKSSLANYEAKLALQQKYPDADHALTEYEKDLALKRYLIKIGKLEEAEVDHTINMKKDVEKTDSEIVVEGVTIEPPKNTFKPKFFGILAAALLLSFIIMGAASVAAGLICLGITAALFGLVAAANLEKFKDAEAAVVDDATQSVAPQELENQLEVPHVDAE